MVKQFESDQYYRSFKSWDHVVTMLFGILSRCDSMIEASEGLQGMRGKLNHLNLAKAPAKSSAGDGLRNRSNAFFEALYYQLAALPYLPSSPPLDLFKDGKLIHMIERHYLGGRPATMIADNLVNAFYEFC